MRSRVKEWLVFIGLMLMWTGLLGYMHDRDTKAERMLAYESGYVVGQQSTQPLTDDEKSDIALKWWVGSDEIEYARKRLCGNLRKGVK